MDLARFARFTLPLALALLTACVGNEGDQCQEADDCNDGLVCCKLGGGDLSGRGTCEPEGECRATPVDAGPREDAGVADAGEEPDAGDALACGADAPCPTGLYCDGPACDGDGTCAVIPDSCSGVYEPVCACPPLSGAMRDTFVNACFAAQAGRRVASAGACSATPLDAGTDAGGGSDAGTDAGTADAGPDGG